jgi:hypothetical protein
MPKGKPGAGMSPATAMKEFRKRCRSILWREDPGKDKKTYNRYQRLIEEFMKDGGMTQDQAVVEAAKDFLCLKKVFRAFDVSDYDPHPESHPDTPAPETKRKFAIRCEGKELSYRENLSWAMATGGKWLRKREAGEEWEPKSCPNDQAYYLYVQAKEQSDKFLQRLGQVEAKGGDDGEDERLTRKSSKRAIDEIDAMLATLEEKEKAA